MMADLGVTITHIQQLLGHGDVITTKGYVQPNFIRNKNLSINENQEIFQSAAKLFELWRSSIF